MTATLDAARSPEAPPARGAAGSPLVRAVLTEARRSTAPMLGLATAGTGLMLLFAVAQDWGGRWSGLASSLRLILLVLVPLVGAVAGWQGGREHRRQLGALLGSTPRPGWQPLLVTFGVLTAAAWIGYAVVFAVGAVLVAPVASYRGGDWPVVAAGGLPALAAAVALGLAVGRALPLRVSGLLIALVLYVIPGVTAYSRSGSKLRLLMPYGVEPPVGGVLLDGTVLLQSGWFVGLAVLAIAWAAGGSVPVVGSRGPIAVAVAGALLAAGSAGVLFAGPVDRWRPDPAARALVCTKTGPEVCVQAVNAFLLPEVAPVMQKLLSRAQGVPGAPRQARQLLDLDPGDMPAGVMRVPDLYAGWDGKWVPTAFNDDPMGEAVNSWFGQAVCPPSSATGSQETFDALAEAYDLARGWLTDKSPVPEDDADSAFGRRWARLQALTPAQRREWFVAFVAADRSCDDQQVLAVMRRLDAR